MTEKDDKNIRRFSRRDQKKRLQKPKSLFPDNDDVVNTDEDKQPGSASKARQGDERFMPPTLNLDDLDLPDTDSEALQLLSSLQEEVRSPKITPAEERYPPLAPVAPPIKRPHPTQKPVPPPAIEKRGGGIYNVMTFLILVASALVFVWFGFVWVNPQSNLNPFPPSTPFLFVTATPGGSTVVDIGATPDAEGQIFVVITDTPAPTTEGTQSPFPFVHQDVLYAPNSNNLGCNWQSVAGTVTDGLGNALDGYRVRVIGEDFNEVVFSGASQAFGDGGYEFPLVGTPQEQQVTMQLFSPEDVPLSDEIDVTVRQSCDANVAIINFVQNQ